MKPIFKTLPTVQKKPFQGRNLLSGLLFCGDCGARFYMSEATRVRKNGKKVRYYHYRCYSKSGQKKMIKSLDCKSKGYQRDKLNQIIIEQICKLSTNPDEIRKLQTASIPSVSDNSEVLKNRLIEIDKQIEKLLDLYQLGNIDVSKISIRIDELNKEKEKLTKELEEQKVPLPPVGVEEALDIMSNAETIFQDGTPEEQQAFVRSLIKKIIIYEDHLEIRWFSVLKT